MPRLSAKLDVQGLSSLVSLKDLQRPIYADNALTDIKNHQSILLATLRETNFEPIQMENLEKVNTEEVENTFKKKINVVK